MLDENAMNLPMLVIMVDPIGAHGGMLDFDSAYCRYLAAEGLEVVFVTNASNHVASQHFDTWCEFVGIFGKRPLWFRGLMYAVGYLKLLSKLRHDIKKRLIIIHQQFTILIPIELVFLKIAQLMGIKIILSPHDPLPLGKNAKAIWLRRFFYKQFDAIIANSEYSRDQLMEFIAEENKVYFVPHGHLGNHRKEGKQDILIRNSRSKLGIPIQSPVMLFLGSIREDKGLSDLLRSMVTVVKILPDAILIVAGRTVNLDIKMYEKLIDELGIRNNVRTRWEYIPDDELPLYYRSADVAVLPYINVYQSGAIMRAYSYSLPVIASAVGGLREQIIDGETGILVPPRDQNVLANSLVKILSNRSLAEKMGLKGNNLALDIGDWQKVAKLTINIYEATI
jgi:D-inositol-3-phosphate glycosyltransferase